MALLLFCWFAFLLGGCSTPPPSVSPTAGKTLNFQVNFNDSANLTTQFRASDSTPYLGIYRIVVNTLDSALIGNQRAVTTSPDTWTDYFELDANGWYRNHRIALPTSQQQIQFSGLQPITPGLATANSLTLAFSLPDQYLGNATKFNVSVITYIAQASNPGVLYAIDALGPSLLQTSSIDYMSFDFNVSGRNTLPDSGGTSDWATPFSNLTSSNYQNFDIKSFTVFIQ